MVSMVGGTSLAQTMLARLESRKAQAAAPETAAVPAASTDDAGAGAATATSAQSAAAARVGGQLDAQFDAARVQRAQDEASPGPAAGTVPPGPPPVDGAGAQSVDGEADEDVDASAATATAGTDASAATGATDAGAAATVHMGGGASASSDSAATDYIAEADTNNDRKVSEQERIAYARKQASEAKKAPHTPDAAQQSRAQEMQQEVQQAYLPQETSGTQLDISA